MISVDGTDYKLVLSSDNTGVAKAIYEFCLEQLTHANMNKDAGSLPFVSKSLTDLREAWAHIAAETGE